MARDLVSDELMIRYLLGDVSDEERIRLEEHYFVDDDAFEQLSALEDELIDDYVGGELTEIQQTQFELYFLSSAERRRKLAFAESLARYLAAATGVTPAAKEAKIAAGWDVLGTGARWSFAAACAAVLIVGTWLVRDNWRLRAQLRQIQAEQTQLKERDEELARQLAQLNAPAIGSAPAAVSGEQAGTRSQPLPIVALALTPGLLRGSAEQPTLVIPHGPHLVRLQVNLDSNPSYESYIATLETVEGTRIWSKEGLRPVTEGGLALVLELPSSLLRSEDYILKLRGKLTNAAATEVAGYSFRVIKR